MSASRQPGEVTPRIAPLARLPVFFALDGKRAVVAGGSAAAAWKAELLAAAGAAVEVYAQDPSDAMAATAAGVVRGSILLHRRDWRAADLAGAAIAVGDFADDEMAARFAAAARRAGVPVNVVDKPAFCDFAFGSIVNRSPLVVGISTDGAAPVFAQAIRARIEALIPHGFARWAAAAQGWRSAVQSWSVTARRTFWQRFAAYALAHPNDAPGESDFDVLRARLDDPDKGTVTLVGAGPGDPELLTLRAVRALQAADVILFDDLVSPQILDFARREAKKMLVGKTGHRPSCRQDDINALMVALAKSGKRVVRLKGGDPMLFGRAGEEIAACRKAGLAVEVVPGVTAAQGAAARLGVSLTHRLEARRVQYVTGHDRDGALPADIDWPAVADPAATTVVYMPLKTLGALADRAITHGLPPSTPAVAVARATRPDEKILWATVADLPGRLVAEAPDGPVLVLIGQALGQQADIAVAASDVDRAHRCGMR
jgi:uroporphyrin-III C-methyltransferase / precorrin-2 dehydrogenase / sirohydrochlorin ferrochelatase